MDAAHLKSIFAALYDNGLLKCSHLLTGQWLLISYTFQELTEDVRNRLYTQRRSIARCLRYMGPLTLDEPEAHLYLRRCLW